MQHALTLAQRATGCTSPNPLVGAVVMAGGSIVGEGWHHAAGEPHAEIEAIRDAGEKTRGATLYVTLEPCAHHGRTPPCTDAIIEAGLRTVVYAIADPNPSARGGAALLQAQGIRVVHGVCESEARHINRFFFHHLDYGIPLVIAKFAQSLDGRSATRTGHSQWISGIKSRHYSHQLRQSVDAILVGAQTVVDDDPRLTVRLPETEVEPPCIRHPLRIVLDSKGRVPLTQQVLSDSSPGNTLVATTEAMSVEHESQLRKRGIDVLRLPSANKSEHVNIEALLHELGNRSVQSLLVEGGNTVLGAFLDGALIDEVWAFLAPILIGGTNGLPSFGGQGIDQLINAPRLTDLTTEQVGEDLLIRANVNYSREAKACSPE